MSSYIKAELAATCSSLGRMHEGKYIIDSQCYESVRDIIRFIRKDDEYHEIRTYLGEARIVQSDLINIATSCGKDDSELFDVTIRLLVNLTNPVMLLYQEEIPAEKVGRNIYMKLMSYHQDYKSAFCNIDFWKAVFGKLSNLFEMDWTERSEDDGLQIERLLVLLRNVLQVPADVEFEKRPENDITIHDKVLWALRQSQLLELLLYVTSNRDEERYYLHLLEIFSLILREQNPTLLANCKIQRSDMEKEKDLKALLEVRQREKVSQHKYKNMRNYNTTFILKNVKSISDKDVVYHKSLDKLNDLQLTKDKKRLKTPKNKFPVESERTERRSTFSVRLFLKEFCLEFLNCSFNRLMNVVKDKLVSGKGLSNDESYYFWSLKFFLEFSCAHQLDIKLISECVNVQTFHFIQTQLDNCFMALVSEKKKTTIWVRRIHLILKAYSSLLQTLQWMDSSKDSKVKEISNLLKNQVFYVPEYREMMLFILFKYDPFKFSLSYLRDLIQTTHLFVKLLQDFCKDNRLVVGTKKKKRKKRKKKQKENEAPKEPESYEEKWEKMKDEIFELLSSETTFPEVPPLDPLLDITDDEQKENAMKKVQRLLHAKEFIECIGLLRSARQVWPENDHFGASGAFVEDEIMTLQEICLAELGNVEPERRIDPEEPMETTEDGEREGEDGDEGEDDDDNDNSDHEVVEQNFDVKEFIKRLAHKKVVEGCGILLKNYKRNTAYTNHCIVKLMYRVGWECCMPSMLYQASLFLTLLRIMEEKFGDYKEINKFTVHLFRKFRRNAEANPKIYMELLFWKNARVAYEVENGYGQYKEPGKAASWPPEEEDELRRLWAECDESLPMYQRVDWARMTLINDSRSRVAVVKKLKELMLIPQDAITSKHKMRGGGRKRGQRQEEMVAEPIRLFNDSESDDEDEGTIPARREEESRMLEALLKESEEESSGTEEESTVDRSKRNKKGNVIEGESRLTGEGSDRNGKRNVIDSDDSEDEPDIREKESTGMEEESRGVEEESRGIEGDSKVTGEGSKKTGKRNVIDSDDSEDEEDIREKESTRMEEESRGVEEESRGIEGDSKVTGEGSKRNGKRNVIDSDDSEDEGDTRGKGSQENCSKWKRRRYIGSDSEVDEAGSAEEARSSNDITERAKIIDSDSDPD